MFKLIRFFLKLSALAMAVLAGGAVLVKFLKHSQGDAQSDDIDLVTCWGGTEIVSTSAAFRGGAILTWWGGTNLDLRQAQLDHDWGYISIKTIFGGTNIIVPEGWRVEVRGRGIAGGIDSPANDGLSPEAPLLDIDAFALFGGVSISRKAAETE